MVQGPAMIRLPQSMYVLGRTTTGSDLSSSVYASNVHVVLQCPTSLCMLYPPAMQRSKEHGEYSDGIAEKIHLVWQLRESAGAWRTKGESGKLMPLVYLFIPMTAIRSDALPLSHSCETTRLNSRQLTPLRPAKADNYSGR
jgi:hypothetical protein